MTETRMHTCHEKCDNPICLLVRERDGLAKECDRLTGLWIEAKDEANRFRAALEKIALEEKTGALEGRKWLNISHAQCSEVIRRDTLIAREALGCLCQNGIRGRYCAGYHVKPSSPG